MHFIHFSLFCKALICIFIGASFCYMNHYHFLLKYDLKQDCIMCIFIKAGQLMYGKAIPTDFIMINSTFSITKVLKELIVNLRGNPFRQ